MLVFSGGSNVRFRNTGLGDRLIALADVELMKAEGMEMLKWLVVDIIASSDLTLLS